MVILFSILAVICLIMLIIGLVKPEKALFWLKPEKRKKSLAIICYGLGLIVFCAIAGVIYYNENTIVVETETVTVETPDQSYAGITDISVEDVKGGTDNKVVGQRGVAYFSPEDMTKDSLTSFYNDVVANSGYDYYTLINKDDNLNYTYYSKSHFY